MRNQSNLPYLLCELANAHGGDEQLLNDIGAQYGDLKYPRKGI
mgnify:CR=1 FL=1